MINPSTQTQSRPPSSSRKVRRNGRCDQHGASSGRGRAQKGACARLRRGIPAVRPCFRRRRRPRHRLHPCQAPKRSATTTCCCSGATPLTATPLRQVPATAAFLGIPQVTLASSIDVKDGWVYCDRVLEDSTEKVRAKLPALVTVTAEINTPRYPTPINIMKALKKPRAVWNAQDLGADTAQTGIPGSPSSTKVVFERPSAIPTPPTLRAAPKRSQQNSLTCSKQSTWSEEVWQMAKEDYKGIWYLPNSKAERSIL